MEKRNTAILLQILAICSALGLGGVYVWRQQQKSVPSTNVQERAKSDKPTVISSSKSLVVDFSSVPADGKEVDVPLPPQEPKADERVLMPSSKSFIIQTQPEKQDAPKLRTLLPSSKSSSPLLDHPGENNP